MALLLLVILQASQQHVLQVDLSKKVLLLFFLQEQLLQLIDYFISPLIIQIWLDPFQIIKVFSKIYCFPNSSFSKNLKVVSVTFC